MESGDWYRRILGYKDDGCIFHCSARDRVLKLYGITHRSSECQNTCLETYFCAPCALAQERREIVIREGEYNSEGREILSAEVEVPTQAPQAQEMSLATVVHGSRRQDRRRGINIFRIN